MKSENFQRLTLKGIPWQQNIQLSFTFCACKVFWTRPLGLHQQSITDVIMSATPLASFRTVKYWRWGEDDHTHHLNREKASENIHERGVGTGVRSQAAEFSAGVPFLTWLFSEFEIPVLTQVYIICSGSWYWLLTLMPRTHSRIFWRKMFDESLLSDILTVYRLHWTFSIGISVAQNLRSQSGLNPLS